MDERLDELAKQYKNIDQIPLRTRYINRNAITDRITKFQKITGEEFTKDQLREYLYDRWTSKNILFEPRHIKDKELYELKKPLIDNLSSVKRTKIDYDDVAGPSQQTPPQTPQRHQLIHQPILLQHLPILQLVHQLHQLFLQLLGNQQ